MPKLGVLRAFANSTAIYARCSSSLAVCPAPGLLQQLRQLSSAQAVEQLRTACCQACCTDAVAGLRQSDIHRAGPQAAVHWSCLPHNSSILEHCHLARQQHAQRQLQQLPQQQQQQQPVGSRPCSSFSTNPSKLNSWHNCLCHRVYGTSSREGSGSTPAQDSSRSSASEGSAAAAASGGIAKLQLPPVIASAAAATGAVLAKASKAAARQVSRLLKLVQQTSLLEAASLQLSSTWLAHSTALTTLAAAAATAGVYHITYSAAAVFVDMSSPAAMFGCVALSTAAVAGLGLHMRSGFVVDPERVYHVAMRKLTQHAGLQEVMGTPLAGSPMRVQLVTRGSIFMQETLLPKRRAPRIHMLFPLTGPLKSGVVSLEAKKTAGGKYAFKTLVVELPSKALKGEAGTAAATAAALHAVAESSTAGSTSGSSSGSGSQPEAAAAASGLDAEGPARVYIIGSPKASSSSDESSSSVKAAMRSQVPTAQVLLEQLKQPLVFALQQNVVIYQTEDELEGELGYDTIPELDPEQLTLLDKAKQGTCYAVRGTISLSMAAGCKVVQLVRKSMKQVQAKAGSAPAKAAAAGDSEPAATSAVQAGEAPPAGDSEVQQVTERKGSSNSKST